MITKRLNLINKDLSEIPYAIDKYPDGQRQLTIDLPDNKCHLNILMDIGSGEDLFIIMQLADIINRRQLTCTLTITYLLSARTDRLFSWNTSHTLKVVADVINSFNADEVRILTPHSDMSLKLIKNSKAIEPFNYMMSDGIYPFMRSVIVSPDEGAKDRVARLESEGYNFYGSIDSYHPYCKKVRDDHGKVSNISVLGLSDLKGQLNLIVLDDLCDGGGTYEALRPALDKYNAAEVNIMITHAIQMSGITKLASLYDKVYITNSYEDWTNFSLPDNVYVYDIISKLENE